MLLCRLSVKAGGTRTERGALFSKLLGFGKNSAFSLREAASAPSPKSIADDLYARNSGASTRSEQPMTEEHVSGALSRMLGASQQPADSISSTQTTKKLTSDSLTRMLGENQSPLSGASATSSSKQSTNTSTSGALSRMLRGSQNPLNDGNGSPNSSKGGSSRASSSSRSGRSVSGQASNQSNNNRSGVSLDRPPNNHHHHRSHTSASADRAFQNDSSRNRSGGCGGANASPTSTIAGRLSIALGSKEGNNNTTVGPATTRKVVYKVSTSTGNLYVKRKSCVEIT
jgi:cellulose 1,4-beta-cellobiosidase